MSFAEDFTPFFQTLDFATAAIYTPDGGSPTTVNGIYDHAYVEVNMVQAERPIFICETANVAGVAKGDALSVDGTDYLVVEPQPDGTGEMTLVLEEV